MCPICRFAIGAATAEYFAISAVMSGAAGTSRVTILLLIVIEVTSCVFLSTRMSMSVTSRPNENALVTGFPSMTQLYG